MICKKCNRKMTCKDSRGREDYRRRMYKCSCGKTFTTIEVPYSYKKGNNMKRKAKTLIDYIAMGDSKLWPVIRSLEKEINDLKGVMLKGNDNDLVSETDQIGGSL